MSNRFVYPFNFVPPPEAQQNGRPPRREPMKSLERFDGSSGRIEFTLTPLTPLFIPDPEETQEWVYGGPGGEIKKSHKFSHFFNVGGQLAIPGTSIKGVIRSVAEAVTGSSLGVISKPKDPWGNPKRFSYRKSRNFTRTAGRIDNPPDRNGNGGILIPYDRAMVPSEAIKDLCLKKYGDGKVSKLRGEEATVTLWNVYTGPGGGTYLATDVTLTTGESWSVGAPASPTTGAIQRGILCPRPGRGPLKFRIADKTGNTLAYVSTNAVRGIGENSRNISVNVEFRASVLQPPRPESFPPCPRVYWLKNLANSRIWQVSPITTTNAFIVIPKGWEKLQPDQTRNISHHRIFYNPKNPIPIPQQAAEDFVAANDRTMEQGEFVYFQFDQNVKELGPVEVFRTAEKYSLEDVINRSGCSLQPPTDLNHLCPATRLFGLVQGNTSLAGRVSVNVSWSNKIINDCTRVPLKILAEPKPSYYPFYLTKRDAPLGGYSENDSCIRGRKFYWHHVAGLQNDKRSIEEKFGIDAENWSKDGKLPQHPYTSQNTTAWVCPEEGTKFKGSIDFESLDDFELGLLLWCLGLEQEDESKRHALKLGMGKPIGMGSFRFTGVKVFRIKPEERYSSFATPGEEKLTRKEIENLLNSFKEKAGGDTFTFETLDRVRALRIMLDPGVPSMRPSYRAEEYQEGGRTQPVSADEAFEYFMAQKRQGPEPLKTPSQIKDSGQSQKDQR